MSLQSIYKNKGLVSHILSYGVHIHMWEDFSATTPAEAMLFVLDKSGKILVASTAVDYPDLNAQETSNTFLPYLPCMTLMQTCLMC